jgi:hypothetical protein
VIVRKLRATLTAVLFGCAGVVSEVSAGSEPTWEDFKVLDAIGVEWAYSGFLQRYPTGEYADLARERIASLRGLGPDARLSRMRTGVPASPEISSRRLREQNYGDAYFPPPSATNLAAVI